MTSVLAAAARGQWRQKRKDSDSSGNHVSWRSPAEEASTTAASLQSRSWAVSMQQAGLNTTRAARIRAGWCAVDVGNAPCPVVPVSGCASRNITAAKHLTNDVVYVCMRLQVVQFADRTGRHHLLGLDRFADHTGREAWDYSAWVRVYSTYLDERLGAFRCVQ